MSSQIFDFEALPTCFVSQESSHYFLQLMNKTKRLIRNRQIHSCKYPHHFKQKDIHRFRSYHQSLFLRSIFYHLAR